MEVGKRWAVLAADRPQGRLRTNQRLGPRGIQQFTMNEHMLQVKKENAKDSLAMERCY